MPLRDKHGSLVKVGDVVTFEGTVESIVDDPNYVNCTVLLTETMPPSGAQVRVKCNTAQLTDTMPQAEPAAADASAEQPADAKQTTDYSWRAQKEHRK